MENHNAKPEDLSPLERFERFARAIIIAVPKSGAVKEEPEYQQNQVLSLRQTSEPDEGGGQTIFQRVASTMKSGATIPGTNYVVKGLGKRRGQDALVYQIRNSHKPTKPSEKGVNESEWQKAYDRLMQNGDFSRKWFETGMKDCADGQPCNFAAIGKTFVSLGLAEYEDGSGTYTRRNG
jgi:hypothetical protein